MSVFLFAENQQTHIQEGERWLKVIKALNNNMVLVRDSSGREMICQGKGIGFQKRAGDSIDNSLVERRFVPETADDSRYFEQLFSEIAD